MSEKLSEPLLVGSELLRHTLYGYDSGRDTLSGPQNGGVEHRMSYDERQEMKQELLRLIGECLDLNEKNSIDKEL